MGLAVLLSIIFAGVQKHPFGYISGGDPIVTVFPIKGTTYVSGELPIVVQEVQNTEQYIGMSAFLNIAYTLNGQATIPSVRLWCHFCSNFYTFSVSLLPKWKIHKSSPKVYWPLVNINDPYLRSFTTALWAVTIAEIITFILCGATIYHFVGVSNRFVCRFSLINHIYRQSVHNRTSFRISAASLQKNRILICPTYNDFCRISLFSMPFLLCFILPCPFDKHIFYSR
jgi:hypothetical protein